MPYYPKDKGGYSKKGGSGTKGDGSGVDAANNGGGGGNYSSGSGGGGGKKGKGGDHQGGTYQNDHRETFATLGLNKDVVDALHRQKIDYPTPMQLRALKENVHDFADMIVETAPHEGRSTCIAAFAMHCALESTTPSNRCAVVVTDSADRVEVLTQAFKHIDVPKTRYSASFSCKNNQPKLGDGADVYVSTVDVLQNASNTDCSTAVSIIVEDASKIDPVHLSRLLRKFVAASPSINIALFTRGSPCDIDYTVRYMLRRTSRRYIHRNEVKPRYTFLLCQDQFDRAEINARITQLQGLRRVLILTHNKEVRDLKSHLHQEFGFRTYSIQRNTSPIDRERVLSDFLACDFAVLVAMDAYTGVDLMDCDAVIQYYPPQKSMPDIEWREFTNHLNTTGDGRNPNPCLVTTLVGLDDLALCSFFQQQVGAVDEPILNVTPFHKKFAEIIYNPREVAAEKMGESAGEGGVEEGGGGGMTAEQLESLAAATGAPITSSTTTTGGGGGGVTGGYQRGDGDPTAYYDDDGDYYDDYEDDEEGGGGGRDDGGGGRRRGGGNYYRRGSGAGGGSGKYRDDYRDDRGGGGDGYQGGKKKTGGSGGGSGGGKKGNQGGDGKNSGGGKKGTEKGKGGKGGKNGEGVPLPRSHRD